MITWPNMVENNTVGKTFVIDFFLVIFVVIFFKKCFLSMPGTNDQNALVEPESCQLKGDGRADHPFPNSERGDLPHPPPTPQDPGQRPPVLCRPSLEVPSAQRSLVQVPITSFQGRALTRDSRARGQGPGGAAGWEMGPRARWELGCPRGRRLEITEPNVVYPATTKLDLH